MTPRVTPKDKAVVMALIGLGFAGLIGAHEWLSAAPSSTAPFILAAFGVLCFIAAGLMARRLTR